jgi:hypothetical protein
MDASVVEWLEGERFLIVRVRMDHPDCAEVRSRHSTRNNTATTTAVGPRTTRVRTRVDIIDTACSWLCKSDDRFAHIARSVERKKMAAVLNRRHVDICNKRAVTLALGRPRPIAVAPNEQDGTS